MFLRPRWWTAAALAVLIAAATGRGTPAARVIGFQGTPTPTDVSCEVPSPAPQAEATDGTGGADLTPPPAAASPGIAAVDATTAAALEATARALAACLSAGETDVVAELASEQYLGVLAGVGEPLTGEEYAALAADLPVVPVTVRSVSGAEIDPSGAATAEVVYVVANQLVRARWTFGQVPAGEGTPTTDSTWRVDREEVLLGDAPGAAMMQVELDEYEITTELETVSGPDLVLTVRNVGEEDHEALAVRLEDDASATDLLGPGPGLPSGITFAGEIVVPAGEEAALVLVDLEPGTYALVCLFPDEEGTPHLALGMEAEITVR
ncbi:MAG: hypothetical protein M3R02_21345 [Chloroflexota bacterium]|nr:hypothetical protein [Chloroflexota bacterium]